MAAIGQRIWALVHILLLVALTVDAYDIKGATGGVKSSGERPARQDLRDLQKSGPAFDLYIQALKEFGETDQKEKLSLYEVAGIHGQPYKSWDGVKGSHNAGYCAHASTLFPFWHRPYLALFEVCLSHPTIICGLLTSLQ